MDILTKEKLRGLYVDKKLSMNEVANRVHCSLHTVVYCMKKFDIKRRTRSDAAYVKANPQGDPFNIKTDLTSEEQQLFGLGIGIYWGEGNKVAPHAIRVANTDPAVLRAFICFLKRICQIEVTKLHYSIVAFQDSEVKLVRKFWATQLKISESSFGTIVRIAPQGKGTYKKKSQYGVCTVTFGNIKLKEWIMSQIRLADGARVV